MEVVRRMFAEFWRLMKRDKICLDISIVNEKLAVGAAPKSFGEVRELQHLGFCHVIDLRAERRKSDILAKSPDMQIAWLPTYDDWKPKSFHFFKSILLEINKIDFQRDAVKLCICCGAGEHRAPLVGTLALVTLGYSLEDAAMLIKKARPRAEFLSIYISCLQNFIQTVGIEEIRPSKSFVE